MNRKPIVHSGVIWISGYSGAGKTTVGRNVCSLLREAGMNLIFLDGDDMRSIFSHHWGFERDQRIELAHIYFRLASHLASQGFTVVICAVAMYREVFEWVRKNIPKNLQVYLDVPEEERVRRDKNIKNIYLGDVNFASMYDPPEGFDLILRNFDQLTPNEAAQRIVDKYLNSVKENRDFGRRDHWLVYYSKSDIPSYQSSFAEYVISNFKKCSRILEIGCGNGRDASFFAKQGHIVTAIDLSEEAIKKCIDNHASLEITFVSGSLDAPSSSIGDGFDVVYSRFVLHAMPLEEEVATLKSAFTHLRNGGVLYVECRSIEDPLARQGEILSPTERINGHYRRFIVLHELQNRLANAGFEVVRSIESNGLAVFGDEDPVVIRIEARKP